MLLDARESGLSQADALRLEAHLASCEACRRDAERLDGLRALADRVDGTLSPAARQRAIGAALSQADAQRRSGVAGASVLPLRAGAALAVAALGALALRAALGAGDPPAVAVKQVAPVVVQAARAPGDRVLSGSVEVDGRLAEEGSALATARVLHASSAARVALEHADVDLARGTDVRWDRAARVLRLEAGSLVADVDPSAHRTFAVETARFRVLVLGTRFSVSLDAVSVERGGVRVIGVAPQSPPIELGPGERFSVAPDAAPAPAPARASRPAKSAAEWLGEARAQLAAQHVASARHAIDAALSLAPERALHAEALSLRADCALIEGDLGGAVEAYLRVARAFAALPAGQNALFAAARIESDRGHSAVAAQLLERYLAAYPQGHFVREARARLQELGAALDRAP
jgi:ferric-dicitrate binding protein FerR (iron transport regulator)